MSTAQQHPLSHYRADVARRARLSPEVERDLAERYRSGDRQASRRLIEGCLDCVMAIAYEYRRWGAPIEDLVQEGNIGLLKAVERFDPGRGVRLATYAGYWIRAEIREYVARHYRIVQLGSSKGERRALRLYRKTREQRPEVLAAMSGLSAERVTALLPLLLSGDVSLTAQPGDDRPDILERLADGKGTPEQALCDADERQHVSHAVADAISALTPREQDIVRQRLLADEPATLERLGVAWGVSRERVRQIEQSTKARMRVRLEVTTGERLAAGGPRRKPALRQAAARPA
jgi:RNA polymerase sigma-32 factor